MFSKCIRMYSIFFALVQELIDRPSYINEQLLEHDAYISCLQLKKVNVANDAMHNKYLYNHTAYYHVLQQVIAFLVRPGFNLGLSIHSVSGLN